MTKSPSFLTSFVLIFLLIHSSVYIADLTFLPWFTWIPFICHLKKESWSQSPYRLLSWNFMFLSSRRHQNASFPSLICHDLKGPAVLPRPGHAISKVGRRVGSRFPKPTCKPGLGWQVSLWNIIWAHHLRPFCTSGRLAPGSQVAVAMAQTWRWSTFWQMLLRWLWRRSKDTKWMTVARLKNSCCRSSRYILGNAKKQKKQRRLATGNVEKSFQDTEQEVWEKKYLERMQIDSNHVAKCSVREKCSEKQSKKRWKKYNQSTKCKIQSIFLPSPFQLHRPATSCRGAVSDFCPKNP